MFMMIGYMRATSYFNAEKSLKCTNNWILCVAATCGINMFGVFGLSLRKFKGLVWLFCYFFFKFHKLPQRPHILRQAYMRFV